MAGDGDDLQIRIRDFQERLDRDWEFLFLVAGRENQRDARRVRVVDRGAFAEPRKVQETDEIAETEVEPEACGQAEKDDPKGVQEALGDFRG